MKNRKHRDNQEGEDRKSETFIGRVINANDIISPDDIDQAVLGLANYNGDFNITDGETGPNVVYRSVVPFASITNGYSLGTDPSAQDTGTVLDSTIVATTPLYPMTPHAGAWDSHVIPTLQTLFGAGLTTNNQGLSKEVITRYVSMLVNVYSIIYSARVINHITYHQDWNKVHPFTGIVPPHLYKVADQFLADDISYAVNWAPLADRLERHVLFPFIIAEVRRQLAPMLSYDINGQLMVPTFFNLGLQGSDYLALAEARLKFLENDLADARRAFMSYVPYPMSGFDLWSVDHASWDRERMAGWFNSPNDDISVFGDTFDPEDQTSMLMYDNTTNIMLYYSLTAQPTWGELRNSTFFQVDFDAIDNTFALASPHRYSRITIMDEYDQQVDFDGTPVATTDNAFELLFYTYNRYAMNNTSAHLGLQAPGYMGAKIHRETVNRMCTGEVLRWVSAPVLRQVAQQMTGASLREIRQSIKALTMKQS